MAAGKHGSPEVTITFDSVPLTDYIDKLNGVEIEHLFEPSTPFGAILERSDYSGLDSVADFTVEGPYDDTTGRTDAAFRGTPGAPVLNKTLAIGFGNSRVATFTVGVKSYSRPTEVGKPTRFVAVLTNMGLTYTDV